MAPFLLAKLLVIFIAADLVRQPIDSNIRGLNTTQWLDGLLEPRFCLLLESFYYLYSFKIFEPKGPWYSNDQ